MASYIKTLKEANGDITYPQTLASAVITTGGTDLETELGKYVTATDIASSSALTPPVSTSMISDGAVTTAKLASSAINRSKMATSDFAATEDGWAVNYLPSGKKMWSIKGTYTTSSFTVGAAYWGYATGVATLPTSVSSFDSVYIMGWASPSNGSGSTRALLMAGGLAGGSDRSFGISVTETYGSGSVTSSGRFSITLIEA